VPAGELNPMARQIAAQYRRDTMSPVMVSGILRIAEFALLTISGLALYAWHVGLDTSLMLHYPVLIVLASAAAVLLLEITDNYQVARLRHPLGSIGTIVAVWGGSLALMTVVGFFLK